MNLNKLAKQKYPSGFHPEVSRFSSMLTLLDGGEYLAEGFTVFDFPIEHHRSMQTTFSLKQINREIRRRTQVIGVFHGDSCL